MSVSSSSSCFSSADVDINVNSENIAIEVKNDKNIVVTNLKASDDPVSASSSFEELKNSSISESLRRLALSDDKQRWRTTSALRRQTLDWSSGKPATSGASSQSEGYFVVNGQRIKVKQKHSSSLGQNNLMLSSISNSSFSSNQQYATAMVSSKPTGSSLPHPLIFESATDDFQSAVSSRPDKLNKAFYDSDSTSPVRSSGRSRGSDFDYKLSVILDTPTTIRFSKNPSLVNLCNSDIKSSAQVYPHSPITSSEAVHYTASLQNANDTFRLAERIFTEEKPMLKHSFNEIKSSLFSGTEEREYSLADLWPKADDIDLSEGLVKETSPDPGIPAEVAKEESSTREPATQNSSFTLKSASDLTRWKDFLEEHFKMENITIEPLKAPQPEEDNKSQDTYNEPKIQEQNDTNEESIPTVDISKCKQCGKEKAYYYCKSCNKKHYYHHHHYHNDETLGNRKHHHIPKKRQQTLENNCKYCKQKHRHKKNKRGKRHRERFGHAKVDGAAIENREGKKDPAKAKPKRKAFFSRTPIQQEEQTSDEAKDQKKTISANSSAETDQKLSMDIDATFQSKPDMDLVFENYEEIDDVPVKPSSCNTSTTLKTKDNGDYEIRDTPSEDVKEDSKRLLVAIESAKKNFKNNYQSFSAKVHKSFSASSLHSKQKKEESKEKKKKKRSKKYKEKDSASEFIENGVNTNFMTNTLISEPFPFRMSGGDDQEIYSRLESEPEITIEPKIKNEVIVSEPDGEQTNSASFSIKAKSFFKGAKFHLKKNQKPSKGPLKNRIIN